MLKIWGASVVSDLGVLGLDTSGEPGTVAGTDKKAIYVSCGEGILSLNEVQYEGKKRMSTQAFLLGAKVEKGSPLTRER